MAKKKSAEPEEARRVIIRAKSPLEWARLLEEANSAHWRGLRIKIQIRDRILAGKPANLKAAEAALKARGLTEFVAEAVDLPPGDRAAAAEEIARSAGLCEFHRRTDRPGIWLPSNNVKAMIKENWSVLGKRVLVRGSRGALAEGLFVVGAGGLEDSTESDWIYLGEEPDGIMESTAHTFGPSGPVASIKRNEYRIRPVLTFEIMMANADSVSEKISDDDLIDTIIHAGEHGVGASRSQGFGRFDLVIRPDGTPSIDEIPVASYAARAFAARIPKAS